MTAKPEKVRAVARDAEEFRRAAEGDPAAFAGFLVRHERRIARIVGARVASSDAEDAFQEVCLRLLAKGHLYDPTRPLVPWLDAVTRQVCAAVRRRLSRHARERGMPGALASLAAPTGTTPDPFIGDAVRRYLSRRRRKERQAVQLVLLSGLTQREAAARLGVPPGTVASWLARGVRAVREHLRIDHEL